MSSGGEALGEALNKVNRKWVMAVLLCIVVLFVVHKLMNPGIGVQAEMKAPAFELEDTEGKLHTLNDYLGDPDTKLVLSFWSTDCDDCIDEISGKNEFIKAKGATVEMLGIAVDSGNLDTLAAAKREHSIIYPVLEADSAIKASYGINNLPVTLLIDDQGTIKKVQEGKVAFERLRKWVL